MKRNRDAGLQSRPGLVGVALLAGVARLQQVEQWKWKACFLLSVQAES